MRRSRIRLRLRPRPRLLLLDIQLRRAAPRRLTTPSNPTSGVSTPPPPPPPSSQRHPTEEEAYPSLIAKILKGLRQAPTPTPPSSSSSRHPPAAEAYPDGIRFWRGCATNTSFLAASSRWTCHLRSSKPRGLATMQFTSFLPQMKPLLCRTK